MIIEETIDVLKEDSKICWDRAKNEKCRRNMYEKIKADEDQNGAGIVKYQK